MLKCNIFFFLLLQSVFNCVYRNPKCVFYIIFSVSLRLFLSLCLSVFFSPDKTLRLKFLLFANIILLVQIYVYVYIYRYILCFVSVYICLYLFCVSAYVLYSTSANVTMSAVSEIFIFFIFLFLILFFCSHSKRNSK